MNAPPDRTSRDRPIAAILIVGEGTRSRTGGTRRLVADARAVLGDLR